jgi:hypothetical protein
MALPDIRARIMLCVLAGYIMLNYSFMQFQVLIPCRSAEASTMRANSTCLRDRLRSAAIAITRSRSALLKPRRLAAP